MAERMHDHELDTSEEVVRAVLAVERPDWSELSMTYVRSSGTSNAMWRLRTTTGADLVVRLPRRAATEESMLRELRLLPAVADSPLAGLVRTPTVRHVGSPTETFPYSWAVFEWLDGTDIWTARNELTPSLGDLATDLARVVQVIGELRDMPAPHRRAGERGGPLGPVLERLDAWLDDPRWHASEFLDVDAVRRTAGRVLDVSDARVISGFVHGDLIPGNLLISGGRLSAVIDWGSAGYGDLAQDLTPAWAVFDDDSRARFRDRLGVDEPTWLRARVFALEQAVGGILYYKPRRHPLGDVMARTLDRILTGG